MLLLSGCDLICSKQSHIVIDRLDIKNNGLLIFPFPLFSSARKTMKLKFLLYHLFSPGMLEQNHRGADTKPTEIGAALGIEVVASNKPM